MKESVRFSMIIARRSPKADYNTVCEILNVARLLHRTFERDCYALTDNEQRVNDRRQKKLIERATVLAENLGAKLYIQPDPRGWPIFLYFEDSIGYEDPSQDGGWHGVGVPPKE